MSKKKGAVGSSGENASRSGSKGDKGGEYPPKKDVEAMEVDDDDGAAADTGTRSGVRTRATNATRRPGMVDKPRAVRTREEMAAVREEAAEAAREAEEMERVAQEKKKTSQERLKVLRASIAEEEAELAKNADHPPDSPLAKKNSRPKPRAKADQDKDAGAGGDEFDLEKICSDREQRGLGFKRATEDNDDPGEGNWKKRRTGKELEASFKEIVAKQRARLPDTPPGLQQYDSDMSGSEFEMEVNPEDEEDDEVAPSEPESEGDDDDEEVSGDDEDPILLSPPKVAKKKKRGVETETKGKSKDKGKGKAGGNDKGKGKGKAGGNDKGKGKMTKAQSKAILQKKHEPAIGNLSNDWGSYIHPSVFPPVEADTAKPAPPPLRTHSRTLSTASSAPESTFIASSLAPSVVSSEPDVSNADGIRVGERDDDEEDHDENTTTLKSATTANICGRVVKGIVPVKVTRLQKEKKPRYNRTHLPSVDRTTYETVIHPYFINDAGTFKFSTRERPYDMWAKSSDAYRLALWDEYATTPSKDYADAITGCMKTDHSNYLNTIAGAGLSAVDAEWSSNGCDTTEKRANYVMLQLGEANPDDPMRPFLWKLFDPDDDEKCFNLFKSPLISYVLGQHLHILSSLGSANFVLQVSLAHPPINALLFCALSVYRALLFCASGSLCIPGEKPRDAAFSEQNWGSHTIGGQWAMQLLELIRVSCGVEGLDWRSILKAADDSRLSRKLKKQRVGIAESVGGANAVARGPAPVIKVRKLDRRMTSVAADDPTTLAAPTAPTTSTSTTAPLPTAIISPVLVPVITAAAAASEASTSTTGASAAAAA